MNRHPFVLVGIISIVLLLISPLMGASGIAYFGDGLDEAKLLIELRMPRVLLGFIVGAGLSASGAALQSFFRNDLASPYTLGVASTASFGAAIAIFLRQSGFMVELSAIAFSFGALIFIISFYYKDRSRFSSIGDLSTLLLIGLALGLISSSGIFFLQYVGGVERSFEIYRWLAGGLEVVGFDSLLAPFIVLVLMLYVLFKKAREFDLVQVGIEFAKGRGVEVERLALVLICSTAIMLGVFVALCGPIGFVGLIIPHVARRMVGARHLILIPYSALLGGSFLLLMDTIARTAFSPIEIPVGIITSLIGGPCFLYLLLRKNRS